MGGKKSLAVGILQIPITRFSESFFKLTLRVGNQVTRSFNSANIGLFNEPFLELSDLFELLQNVSNCSHSTVAPARFCGSAKLVWQIPNHALSSSCFFRLRHVRISGCEHEWYEVVTGNKEQSEAIKMKSYALENNIYLWSELVLIHKQAASCWCVASKWWLYFIAIWVKSRRNS